MKKYVIEREMPGVGKKSGRELCEAAGHSNQVLSGIGAGVQWLETFVTGEKLFCIYLADDPQKIRTHAERSGFPATAIREVRTVLDPTSATPQ